MNIAGITKYICETINHSSWAAYDIILVPVGLIQPSREADSARNTVQLRDLPSIFGQQNVRSDDLGSEVFELRMPLEFNQ